MRGQNLTISATAKDNYKTAVTGGTVNVLIEYLSIPLANKTAPLCSVLSKAHSVVPSIPACPVPPLELKQVQVTEPIPSSFPAGTYAGQVSATDETGRVIQCVKFNMKIN